MARTPNVTLCATPEDAERLQSVVRVMSRVGASRWRRSSLRVAVTTTGETGDASRVPDWMLVAVSPTAAASRAVDATLRDFLSAAGPGHLLLALVDGELAWDPVDGDWSTSATAVPPAVLGVFSHEPRWVDVRPALEAGATSAVVADVAAELAAPVRGVSKSDLVGADLHRHRRAVRIASVAAALLAVAGVVALLLAVAATRRRDEAEARRTQVISQRLAAQSGELLDRRPDVAILLAVEAWQRGGGPESEGALFAAAIRAAAFPTVEWSDGPGSSSVAVRAADGGVVVLRSSGVLERWDPDEGTTTPTALRLSPTTALEFAPDGNLWAVSFDDNELLWINPALTGVVDRFELPGGAELTSATRVGSERIALGDELGRLRVMNLATGRQSPPTSLHGGPVVGVAATADGRFVASIGADGTLAMLRVTDDGLEQRALVDASQAGARPTALAFTADGTYLITGDLAGSVQSWRVADLAVPAAPGTPQAGLAEVSASVHTAPVRQVESFAQSGFATTGLDGTVRIWSAAPLRPIDGADLPLVVPFQIVAVPGEQTLVAADRLGTLTSLDLLDRPRFVTVVDEDAPWVLSGATGDLAAVVNDATDRVALWDLGADPPTQARGTRTAQVPGVVSSAPARGGARLVALTEDQRLVLIDPARGATIDTVEMDDADASGRLIPLDDESVAVAAGGAIHRVSISDDRLVIDTLTQLGGDARVVAMAATVDGRTITVLGTDGRLRQLDARSGEETGPTIETGGGEITGRVAVNDDGSLVAVDTGTGAIRVWSTRSGDPAAPVMSAPGYVTGLAFVNDSDRLGATISDSEFHLWDIPTGRALTTDLVTPGLPESLVILRDRQVAFATVAGGQLVRIDLDPHRAAGSACAAVGRDLRRDEWETYLEGERYRQTCSGLPGP